METNKLDQNINGVDFSDSKFQIKHSARRMKLYIKLNKEETDGWKNVESIASDGLGIKDPNQIAKIMFFRGVNAFFEDLQKRVDDMSDDEKEQMTREQNIESTLGSETGVEDSDDANG